MKQISIFIVIFMIVTACSSPRYNTNVDYIRPVIGAVKYMDKIGDIHGFGKIFPDPATPFGLVQPSPVTRTRGDESGYAYNQTTIEGVCFTSMSGISFVSIDGA